MGAEGCARSWLDTPLGLAGESTQWNTLSGRDWDLAINAGDAHNMLRPETVESLWYLYLATGDRKYQDWGWSIFEAIEKLSAWRKPGSPSDAIGWRLSCSAKHSSTYSC